VAIDGPLPFREPREVERLDDSPQNARSMIGGERVIRDLEPNHSLPTKGLAHPNIGHA
jgi:hypothetical protein